MSWKGIIACAICASSNRTPALSLPFEDIPYGIDNTYFELSIAFVATPIDASGAVQAVPSTPFEAPCVSLVVPAACNTD
jgi:hypothetical protein